MLNIAYFLAEGTIISYLAYARTITSHPRRRPERRRGALAVNEYGIKQEIVDADKNEHETRRKALYHSTLTS